MQDVTLDNAMQEYVDLILLHGASHRGAGKCPRACHSAGALSPSLLKRLLNAEGLAHSYSRDSP